MEEATGLLSATEAVEGALTGDGNISISKLQGVIPEGTPNTFVPSNTISEGFKYKFEMNGSTVEIKWHSPDANAAIKFPGSNSGTAWTAQIKVNGQLLGADGAWYARPSNNTHILLAD